MIIPAVQHRRRAKSGSSSNSPLPSAPYSLTHPPWDDNGSVAQLTELALAPLALYCDRSHAYDFGDGHRNCQVVEATLEVDAESAGCWRISAVVAGVFTTDLQRAWGQVRLAGAVIRADTLGHREPLEQAAWADFFALATPRVQAVIVAAGVRPADRDDCLQEVWMELMRGTTRIDPSLRRGSLQGLLSVIARRTAWRHQRRLQRQLPSDPPPSSSLLLGSGPDPAELCQRREESAILARCVAALRVQVGPEARVLVERYLADDAPLETLAADLDLTPGQLWHRWRKTLQYLRKQLTNEFT